MNADPRPLDDDEQRDMGRGLGVGLLVLMGMLGMFGAGWLALSLWGPLGLLVWLGWVK